MTFKFFTILIFRNLPWLVLVPAVMAGSVFYFTRHEVKVYSSESVIYTGIASGYSLSGSIKSDFFAAGNAFDNLLSLINSRETKQEVVIDLLATHLMIKKHEASILSWDAFQQLRKLVPDSIRKFLIKPTIEETILALRQYMSRSEKNLIFTILNSDHPYYSFEAMENIKAVRINSSDLIKISYKTNDAAICMHTLELLEASFMKKHRLLKEGQSESVIDYFETETRNATARLNMAEQNYLEFSRINGIINFPEQTKAIAVIKENLDVQNHDLEMAKLASSKTLDKVNENIKGRLYQDEYGSAIIKEREQLSDVYSRLAIGEVIGKNEPGHQLQMDSLREVSVAMEKKLQGSVNSLYSQTLTPNGIPTKGVLDEWLKTSLELEQNKAKLTVMSSRKKEISGEVGKYAPLGATLKKFERQINVSEQEYLELLRGLNTAKLTQQNNELTTKLNIVDAPYLPLKANPSKRIIQVVLAFGAGFLMVLAYILGKALLNRTLQQPDKAAKEIGIPLLGIYPLLNVHPGFTTQANLRLVQKLLSYVGNALKPVTIGVISIQSKEGKSTVIELLNNELNGVNYIVERKAWNEDPMSFSTSGDIVLIEFPPLDTLVIKPGALPKLDLTLLVCRANRTWGKIDKELLAIFTKTTGNHPLLLLNGVIAAFAETYIGKMPGKNFFARLLSRGSNGSQPGPAKIALNNRL